VKHLKPANASIKIKKTGIWKARIAWLPALSLLLPLLSACMNQLPSAEVPTAETAPTMQVSTPGPQTPEAEITFRADVNSPAEQPVAFSILDEVSGLAINAGHP
jgi:hypothetical protein